MTDFKINSAGFNKLLNSDQGDVAKYVLGKAIQVHNEAKKLCPVDTGRLRSSISFALGRDKRGIYGKVGSNVSYAKAIEFGSDPYTIRAKNAKSLHFEIDGKDVFVKSVRHPGVEAQPFLRPALKRVIK
jgi:hypothetical protein